MRYGMMGMILLVGQAWFAAAAAAQGTRCLEPGETLFRKRILVNQGMDQPMEMAVAGDGRVLWLERVGKLKVYRPDQPGSSVAGHIDVDYGRDDGGLGLALDPEFTANNWIYIYYSPKGTKSVNRLSRFTLAGDLLSPGSEKILLEVPVQRVSLCHTGGSLAFGPAGDLFLSTGDNVDPFESDGYAPIDERVDRAVFDAQGTSANSNDLRGKILRIRPRPDGSYSIPADNLFPPGTPATRPEIYVMGCRNPFRISVDRRTGWLLWGEVGPDAQASNPLRGPEGFDEFNLAKAAGNFGWPYFVADNRAYLDYDFAWKGSGSAFSSQAPRNESPNNTGVKILPPARQPLLWYSYKGSSTLPGFAGPRTAIGAPLYRYAAGSRSIGRLPPYYDGRIFLLEWSQGWIKTALLDAAGKTGEVKGFPLGQGLRRPIEAEIGPDGVLYVMEWGPTYSYAPGTGALFRLEYTGSYDEDCLPVGLSRGDGVEAKAAGAGRRVGVGAFSSTGTGRRWHIVIGDRGAFDVQGISRIPGRMKRD